MLAELRATNTDLNIEIVGVNQSTDAIYNNAFTAGRVLPWLQDTTAQSVWARWGVTYRDVRILDSQNRLFAIYNLTEHDLASASNRAALKQLFLSAAKAVDSDRDGLPDDWEALYFGGIAAGPGGDQDQDGSDNLQEFIFGIDPLNPGCFSPLTTLRPASQPSAGSWSIAFRRRAGSMIEYQVETSLDLKQWLPASPAEWTVSSARNLFDGTGTSEVRCSRLNPAMLHACEFVRVRAMARQQP